ncbi:MAG: hypothetical protein ABI855_02665, partial [Bacteroidota bacterium]
MKTLTKLFMSILLIVCFNQQMYSQSDISGIGIIGHTGIATYYSGWNAATGIPFDIMHEGALPVHIHTNAGAGTFNNIRQTILGNYNNNSGLIGMGDMGTTAAPYIPNYLLDSYRTGTTSVFHQFINDDTGFGPTNGFRLGINYRPNPLPGGY